MNNIKIIFRRNRLQDLSSKSSSLDSKFLILGSGHMPGLLEMENLHYTCVSGSNDITVCFDNLQLLFLH